MWPSLISKAKRGGLDVIQTYVFWNLHEPRRGQVDGRNLSPFPLKIFVGKLIFFLVTFQYDFSGRRDIVSFIKQIQAQGLYASLRIGPYVESEWSYG